VTEGVAADGLRDSRLQPGFFHGSLQNRFMQMMPAPLPRTPVDVVTRRRENPLPDPVLVGARLFTLQGVRQTHSSPTSFEVCLVLTPDRLEVPGQRPGHATGEHRIAVLIAPRSRSWRSQCNVLYPQTAAFHQPEPRAIKGASPSARECRPGTRARFELLPPSGRRVASWALSPGPLRPRTGFPSEGRSDRETE